MEWLEKILCLVTSVEELFAEAYTFWYGLKMLEKQSSCVSKEYGSWA